MIYALLISTLLSTIPAVEQSEPVFSDSDRQEALALLKKLNEATSLTPTAAGKPAEQPKSMADVTDKMLDMSAKYITQISSMLEKAAPRIWAVMIRQQYAKAVGSVLGPFLCLLVTIVFMIVSRLMWKLSNPSEGFFVFDRADITERGMRGLITYAFPMLLAIIFVFVFANRLANASMYLINPEYYAVKDLLRLVFNPSAM